MSPPRSDADVPEYVVAYGGVHLKAIGAVAALHGLADVDWLRLSIGRTGSPFTFVRDMRAAAELAAATDPVDRRQLLRVTAAAASASTLAGAAPPEALGVLAASGQPHRALELSAFQYGDAQIEAYGHIRV